MNKIAMPTRAANRRQSQRLKLRGYVRVECRVGPCGLGPNIAAGVLDISDSGIRMIVKNPLELDGEVEITLAACGIMKAIKRVAVIRWQVQLQDGRHCIGAEFQKRLVYRDWLTLSSPN